MSYLFTNSFVIIILGCNILYATTKVFGYPWKESRGCL